ncbi:MAG: UDP-N-acetylmuramoyl-L-alanyl-D-glutamate--2,6-diaminopimelate ligase, partial [Clostridiales bacterium]|nr:UDP-N-acetylmuramoyl-L-alanyl-D-glutamate--2,6-diaminopimelate ligase [Clostridiales bacterium]
MEKNFYELKEYISLLEEEGLIDQIFAEEEDLKKRVRHVSYSSKDIGFNTLFICKGAHFSEGYLHEALGKGAFAYVSENKYNVDAPCIKVDDIRKVMPLIADFFYERVWRRICIAGVTGTKGKSTTAYYMKSILDQYLKASKK